MNLYPAIDLFQGKVVRLTRGDYDQCKVYSTDPAGTARGWADQGAQWIHVVDLEGAKSGTIANDASLAAICRSVPAKVQFGGGLRRIEDIEKVLGLGVARVVLGTKAMDRSFLERVLAKFGDRVAVGLDVKRDHVMITGWTTDGNMMLPKALDLFNRLAVRTLIYTDIEKDGVLQGPNWEKLRTVLAGTTAKVILSGGISQLSDIGRCRTITEPNFEGTIIGKALYDKKFTLTDAIGALAGSRDRSEGGKR
ncbi:MAG TPA: 1-(5-phosphoribosyl)-5-[(5-phosphoribosylamino)methylideneamino]imidazole-4-carboxamide isomerase [Candidatus Omnitrophota bacterium]|nr:1-(5-phosphoribosyl)-5-[(5-phosphoribosylamino)methylideneamino]imidazole-4-carboxamide isomerase [Candidatus Omnitrophota bacterium]HPS37132.1 1-(5-phosphoribosyl)-5-[(5-phosphoribosylamino)methylideneamino]imidazole-4-carboxamide isomerase [Candidatus Omnitrophota bacterium]